MRDISLCSARALLALALLSVLLVACSDVTITLADGTRTKIPYDVWLAQVEATDAAQTQVAYFGTPTASVTSTPAPSENPVPIPSPIQSAGNAAIPVPPAAPSGWGITVGGILVMLLFLVTIVVTIKNERRWFPSQKKTALLPPAPGVDPHERYALETVCAIVRKRSPKDYADLAAHKRTVRGSSTPLTALLLHLAATDSELFRRVQEILEKGE